MTQWFRIWFDVGGVVKSFLNLPFQNETVKVGTNLDLVFSTD